MRKNLLLALTVTFFLGAGTACTGPEGAQGDPGEAGLQGETGEPGLPGKDATPCAVTDNEDGSVTITCGDGTEVTLAGGQEGKPGADGKDGSSCAVTDNEDGTKTVSCDDGTSVTLSNGTDGEDGPQGDPGAQGEPGKDGSSCSVATNEDGAKTITCDDGTSVTLADGADGQPGAQGDPGAQGEPGKDGSSCSATDNGNGTVTIECDDGTSVTISNGKDGQQGPAGDQGPQGEPGEDGLGTLTLPPNGLAGFVRDTANDPVVGATVYLVPANDIPTDPIAVDSIANAIASKVDEPLEDTIALKGAGYAKAVTDMDGIYSIPTVGNGAFFVTVIPAADDSAHLPGGSLCRDAIPKASLVGKRKDITVSTRPSDKATYVGASVCYNCHGIVHEKETLHALGIRVFGQQGPLQDDSRFPDWNKPLKDKFTPTGTTLYFYAYNGNATSPSWKVSETNPGVGVSFTAHMYSNGGKYFVDLANVAGAPKTASYEVGITYGGGLYKQRFITKIGVSRYVLPIQYNYHGVAAGAEGTTAETHWQWQHYNAQNWYDESAKQIKIPATSKSFDNNCAGCHFTGVSVTGDATNGWTAHGVPDINGELDFDGDGKKELLNTTCEACHGAGSEHWKYAGQGRSIVSPGLLTPEREVTICAQCHTRVNGYGGGKTEAPLNADGKMAPAGISRNSWLTNYVSKIDDGMWDTNSGDGLHSKKHHQQVTDFLKSYKYRNPTSLMTCSSCHDLHGESGLSHQILDKLDSANAGEGMCLGCHGPNFPAGATTAKRIQNHYGALGVANIPMGDISCAQCHMPKTAKSGAGNAQATISGTKYFHGDISSHVFDVPLRTGIKTKGAEMMAIPYTNACGTCHSQTP